MLFDLVVVGTEAPGLAAARLAVELGFHVAVVNDSENFRTPQTSGQDLLPISVRYFSGLARFASEDCLEIGTSRKTYQINSPRFVLACGSRPKTPSHIPFDSRRVLTSDEVNPINPVPQSVLIVGAGSHGLAAAVNLIQRENVKVSLVDQSAAIPKRGLPSKDQGYWDILHRSKAVMDWGTTVLGVESRTSMVTVFYNNGAMESFEAVVFAIGREGLTASLNLPHADLLFDESNRLWCNNFGQTEIPEIFAIGSVVGFPRFSGSPEEEALQLLGQMIPPNTPHLKSRRAAPAKRVSSY